MSQPRIRAPRSARRGEIVEIRTLIDHPMDSGIRADGSSAPRNMLATFRATVNGETFFEADFGNGASANPYFVLHCRVDADSAFAFVWTHEDGRQFRGSATVSVS